MRFTSEQQESVPLRKFTELLSRFIPANNYPPHVQRGAYLGQNRYLTRTAYGRKMFLDTRDMTLVPHIILDGVWEPNVTKVITGLLQPGQRVLEVGSNLGWYTLLIAHHIGPSGSLITFEANADLAKFTFDSICINGFTERVQLHSLAVSDKTGETTFHVRGRHLGNSSLGKASQDHLDDLYDSLQSIVVPTVALDTFLKGNDRKIDLMKIDVEGAEPLVFRGMEQILRENEDIMIIMEYSPFQMRPIGLDPAQAMSMLFQLGFNAYRIEDPSGELIPANAETLSQIVHCDLVLTRTPLPIGTRP